MSRDWSVYVEDILTATAKVKRYTEGMNHDAFAADERTVDAVVRNLEIIGEAARILPPECTGAMPEIEWKKVVGLRNILVHQYFGINHAVLWDIVSNKLDPLETACRRYLQTAR